jgi:hypothetical protein
VAGVPVDVNVVCFDAQHVPVDSITIAIALASSSSQWRWVSAAPPRIDLVALAIMTLQLAGGSHNTTRVNAPSPFQILHQNIKLEHDNIIVNQH